MLGGYPEYRKTFEVNRRCKNVEQPAIRCRQAAEFLAAWSDLFKNKALTGRHPTVRCACRASVIGAAR